MRERPRLLIVDDGDRYAEFAHRFLRGYDYATRCDRPGPCWTCPVRPGCTLTHAHDLRELDEALGRSDVDAVLLDVAFDLPEERLAPSREPDLERRRRLQGLDLLAHLRRGWPRLPVILMTSHEELAPWLDADAPLDADEYLALAGESALDARALGLLVERVLARRDEGAGGDGWTWGSSPAMARLRRDALVLARTSLPMLLLGETGTGKSALAERVVHPATRRGGPFVGLDLAAIPSTLVAAELFGTARGAFSGAVDRPGHLERAHGGTLFLDEVGNLPGEVQRMLLLALESGRVTRLGESTARPVDVKLVAATHVDLAAAVRAGAFRADLHQRLNPAARLVVPPLRERVDDLPDLVRAFLVRAFAAGANRSLLADYVSAAGLRGAATVAVAVGRAPRVAERGVTFLLAPALVRALRAHRWPGNLRELERVAVAAASFTLADATVAAEAGRGANDPRALPLPAKLVRELLRDDEAPGRALLDVTVAPGHSLHAVAQSLERRLYERLFAEERGDFTALARRLLVGDPARNARRVRLRFNQLGLRAREK